MRKLIVATWLMLTLFLGITGAMTGSHEMLIGTSVRTPGGEDIGKIIDIVAGPEGQEAFAVLSYWVSADTQKRVAVPFGALTCEDQHCVLKTTRESLDSAPVFVFEGELAQRELAETIYRYFGVQPYWTNEGIKR